MFSSKDLGLSAVVIGQARGDPGLVLGQRCMNGAEIALTEGSRRGPDLLKSLNGPHP